jgi:hypothetical protein
MAQRKTAKVAATIFEQTATTEVRNGAANGVIFS